MARVVVLGGYGIFGRRVSAALAGPGDLEVVVAGRDEAAGRGFAERVGAAFARCDRDRGADLERLLDGADLCVNAAGPFQGADYRVPRAALARGAHYLDLADAREYVCSVGALDTEARARGLFVGAGASSVPATTWALVDAAARGMERTHAIEIALSPGNQNPRGASTVGAILSYVGRDVRCLEDGRWRARSGWSDARRLTFPAPVGERRVHVCEVPDLELFPDRFGAGTVRFHAGLELPLFNFGLSALARLRRLHLLPRPERLARVLQRISLAFYGRGGRAGALAVRVAGDSSGGEALERRLAIVTDDDGPATPSAPAILLARKLLGGAAIEPGARPCAGLLDLDEILAYLEPLGIWCARGSVRGSAHDAPDSGWDAPPIARLGGEHVFVYGTLRVMPVMTTVAGARFAAEDATLGGFRSSLVRGAPYPGAAPSPGARTPGRLYSGLDTAALERLDRFEGELYERRTVDVERADGSVVAAHVYVVRAEHRRQLTDEAWSERRFRDEDYPVFLEECRRFARDGRPVT